MSPRPERDVVVKQEAQIGCLGTGARRALVEIPQHDRMLTLADQGVNGRKVTNQLFAFHGMTGI
jgi:hypothetical protein